MKFVKYNGDTKLFGIHGDRVFKLRTDPKLIKRKGWSKDQVDTYEFINDLKKNGHIKTADTSERSKKIKTREDRGKTKLGRFINTMDDVREIGNTLGNELFIKPVKNSINKIKENANDPEFRSLRENDKASIKYNWNNFLNKMRNKIPSVHKRDQEIKDKVIKANPNYKVDVDKKNKTDEHASVNGYGGGTAYVNDNSHAGTLSHELGHLRNGTRGEHHQGGFMEYLFPSNPMRNHENAHQSLNVLREEDNANRDAVMLPFVHGNATRKELDRYAKDAKLAQGTYNSAYMTKDTPPNLDYHMDKKTKNRFLRLNEDLSYVNRPKVTGYVDLNQYRNK